MKKEVLEIFFVLLIVYLTFVFCDDNSNQNNTQQVFEGIQNETSGVVLPEEARLRRRHHHLWYLWGWPALAIAFFIKVKVIIVSFFVGSAIFLGMRYWWPHKSCSSETPIYIEHSPFSYSHDHIPYSIDTSVHYDHSYETDPYSGYATSYGVDTNSIITSDKKHSIKKRESPRQLEMKFEERLGEIVFMFLGLDTKACRRRFICEMEFRSRLNPITAMGFRIVGRGFFEKYTNAQNELRKATSFAECAAVNAECVFIEHNDEQQNSSAEVEDTAAHDQDNEITEQRFHKYGKLWLQERSS